MKAQIFDVRRGIQGSVMTPVSALKVRRLGRVRGGHIVEEPLTVRSQHMYSGA